MPRRHTRLQKLSYLIICSARQEKSGPEVNVNALGLKATLVASNNPSFKFQLMWLGDPSLQDFMMDWWVDKKPAFGTAMYSIIKKLQYIKYRLKRWNKSCFGNIFSAKRDAQEKVDSITRKIMDQGLSEDLYKEESTVVKELEEWELHKEIYWKQKAWVEWIQEGDRDTQFFYYTVQDRRQGNPITSLIPYEGVSLSSYNELPQEAMSFFANLFNEDFDSNREGERLVLDSIPSIVSEEMNKDLLKPIYLSNIEKVVFGMKKGKAPDPNGFLVKFYKEFWEIVKLDL
ncbi:uncharacterized protein LOC131033978 [Cryptomeria japonica]|uniref:uncharacterized protein LOC131033978 n=1 Tax=Cryptomeria japonica TaxID=3369 RepID=UPI0027DA37AE|nr:uncharacterized protein LOC131033978 [Cryptomeria japonica]